MNQDTKRNPKEIRNDLVQGLKMKVKVDSKKIKMAFHCAGKYTNGYDGCGCHTHQ